MKGPQEKDRGNSHWDRPLKIEPVTENGERFTYLTYFQNTPPARYSADFWFQSIKEDPLVLLSPYPWHVITPWLQNSPEDISRFWSDYATDDAERERNRATSGTAWINRQKEFQLIGIARSLQRQFSDQGDPPVSIEKLQQDLMMELARWVINAVVADNEAPKRLYELLQGKGTPPPPEKGANYFRAFAESVATEERLPTKKGVRIKAAPSDPGPAAAKTFKILGLQGLPRS